MEFLKITLIIFLFFSISVNSQNYDFFFLVLQWPPTFCNFVFPNKCDQPIPAEFSIHGFWPHVVSCASIPAYKQRSTCAAFDVSKLPEKLRNELSRHWPSLLGWKETEFWRHEWQKHGRIASGVLDTKACFSKAVQHCKAIALDVIIHRRYEVGKPYKALDIENDISHEIKRRPIIQCVSVNQQQYLYQKHFCVSRNGDALIDCTAPSQCDSTIPVIIPG